MKKFLIPFILLFPFILGLLLYSQVPEMMPTHWNMAGVVDGYMPKFWGLFLFPTISVVLYLLLWNMPKLDPLKSNIDTFRNEYSSFVLFLLTFFFGVYLFTVLWSLGVELSPNIVFPIALGALFFYLSNLLVKTKKNWFIGIRTPWTMSSEKVWDSTHKLGAKLFKLSALISFMGVLFPDYSFYFVIVPILLFTIYITIFSYIEYRRVER